MIERKPDWSRIIKGCLENDRACVSELISFAQKPLMVFCFHLTKDRHRAEDLTHDAFLKALASLKQIREPNLFMGWLKAIARSLYLDQVKAAANSKVHVNIDELGEGTAGEQALSQDPSISPEQIQALRTLQRLEEADRSILILVDIQECSYLETAEALGIPEGTVKSRLFRAREKFAAIYEGTNRAPRSSYGRGEEKAKQG